MTEKHDSDGRTVATDGVDQYGPYVAAAMFLIALIALPINFAAGDLFWVAIDIAVLVVATSSYLLFWR